MSLVTKLKKTGYELCDINIVQSEISYIEHRGECDTMIEMCGRKVYPVVVAPMAAVTDEHNWGIWLDNNFICVVPRTVDFETRKNICRVTFCSFSLDEAEDLYKNTENFLGLVIWDKLYVCIDIAQGTMDRLYKVCKELKDKFGDDKIEIMTGNVATPLAYSYYAEAGVDYMRLNIGTGSRCTTSANVGVHYPVATLIDEIRMQKEEWEYYHHGMKSTKIIADGGIANFDDIQKCLALGAFAVMNGSCFVKAEEACGEIRYLLNPEEQEFEDGITKERYDNIVANRQAGSYYMSTEDRMYLHEGMPYREYYGMSTKRAQKECGNVCSKTSEGNTKPVLVEYPIAKWADNMKSFLASAMSYCDASNIDEFREKTELIINLSGDKQYRK